MLNATQRNNIYLSNNIKIKLNFPSQPRCIVMPSIKSLETTIVWLRRRLRAAEAATAAATADDAAANARTAAAEEAQREEDEDDDEEDEDRPPRRAAFGANLRALWQVAGGPARRGARAGERRRKSGPEMITSAATKILTAATPSPFLAAAAAPCLLAPLGAVENRGRPSHSLTIPADGDLQPRQFQAAAYHVTWCARANQPPPGGRVEYSHRCHQKRCVEPTHGVWETRAENRSREACRVVGGAGCGHNLLNSRL
ncbi:hypothetical protein GGS24DRAFT_501604 [Hypoxylon argillaceum]|nr:hypothetical protein GGS24DRAFT_501604 [Hypoxylon argillaceum]KAI1155809.1 hypothetical protein F4825DRAFT_447286 [Nemania diffusa]